MLVCLKIATCFTLILISQPRSRQVETCARIPITSVVSRPILLPVVITAISPGNLTSQCTNTIRTIIYKAYLRHNVINLLPLSFQLSDMHKSLGPSQIKQTICISVCLPIQFQLEGSRCELRIPVDGQFFVNLTFLFF